MKLLLVLLSITATAIGYTFEDIKCIPLSTFKLDCNTCYCSGNGTISFCTYAACLTNPGIITYLHIPEDTRSETKKVCEPRTTFKDYCNTCTCSVDGTAYACTMMECDKDIWNKDGSMKTPPYINRVTRSANKQVCQPRSVFKDYCNTCSCADDGTSFVCTRMECDKNIWNADGTLKIKSSSNRVSRSVAKQVCQPRSTFKNYCNSCTCSADGTTYACTRMECNKDIWNPDGTLRISSKSNRVTRSVSKQVCEPLSQFKNYCNTCGCAADGMSYACTRMMCDQEIWNPDGSLKIVPKPYSRVRRSASNQVCEPLKQFKDYCNTCTCAVDGMSFACTRMMCDKNIWNKDGSLKPRA